jgi:hypothetical protein
MLLVSAGEAHHTTWTGPAVTCSSYVPVGFWGVPWGDRIEHRLGNRIAWCDQPFKVEPLYSFDKYSVI